jgi:hypothetical protein
MQERRKIEYRRATSKRSTRFAVDFFCPTSRSIQESEGFFLPTSFIQGQRKYGKAKEAVESARAGLLPQKGDVRKSRKEKKRKRPRKARRWLQQRQGSVCPKPRIPFFWFTSIWVLKRIVSVEVSAPTRLGLQASNV